MALMFLLACSTARAATYPAATASLTDVTTAIGSAAATGDTVTIPAGTVEWTNTLTITKAITLQGAGTNSTIITNLQAQTLIAWSVTSDAPIRCTGIAFVRNQSSTSPTLKISGKSSSGTGTTISSLRVDRCSFTYGTRQVWISGWAYGVVDYCNFLNGHIAVGIGGDNQRSWNRGLAIGTTNSVVVEDNTLIRNSSAASDSEPIYVYPETGARMILRFNSFDGTANTSDLALFSEGHANQNYITGMDSDTRGTLWTERYGNTMAAYKFSRAFYLRGGTHFIYSNVVTRVTTGTIVLKMTEEECWQTLFFDPLRTVWPAEDQITNCFFWANTLNGSAITAGSNVGLQNQSDATFIQENRDWWLQVPNSTNGSPAGIYEGYTRLLYPHPVVRAQDGAAPGVTALAGQTAELNGIIGPVSWTLSDANSWDPVAGLTPTGVSDNHTVLADAGVTFGGSGASRTVTLTPVGGQSGTAIVTISVVDSDGLTGTRSFTNVWSGSETGGKSVSVGNYFNSSLRGGGHR